MGSSSAMREGRYSVRSISMPTRLHPNALTFEESLNKLKAWERFSTLNPEKIRQGLAGLVELYNCVEDFLQLPINQQTLVNQQNQNWVDDMLDASVRLLDACGTMRDVLLQMKEHVQDLQSAVRRRGSEAAKDNEIDAYICFRKKMKMNVSKCIRELKQMAGGNVSSLNSSDQDQNLEKVSSVLREARAVTISVFQCLASLMSVPVKAKPSKWYLVSKLMHNRQLAGDREHEDMGFALVDKALHSLALYNGKENELEIVAKAHKGLDAVGDNIEDILVGLESIFKHLIQNRVILLNAFTH